MASEGAWHSETIDNGQEFHKTRAPQEAPTTQTPAATPPPEIYNPPAKSQRESASIAIIALALRAAQIVFSLIAFAVMASNKESGYYYNAYDFTGDKAYIGVVAMNTIVCLYAVVQLVLSVVNKATVGVFMFSPTTSNGILTFVFDSILAYALMGASGAGANTASFYEGCGSNRYCKKAAASVAMSCFAWAALAASVALFPVRLLRLIKR